VNILVTGSTGFVGKYLLKRLIADGHKVICLLRPESVGIDGLKDLNIEIWTSGLFDTASLKNKIKNVDIIYHLAGSVFSQSKKELFRANCEATASLYSATADTNIKKFIYLSSITACGPSDQNSKNDENVKPHPISLYGQSKLAAELAIRTLFPTVKRNIVIVRCPLIYGEGMNSDSRLFVLTSKLVHQTYRHIGNGNNQISFCSIDNLIDFFSLIPSLNLSNVELFNIADKRVLLMRELVSLICSTNNIQEPNKNISPMKALFFSSIIHLINRVSSLKSFDFPAPEQIKELMSHWVMDISKAEKYGYSPRSDVNDLLKKVVRLYQSGA